MEKLIATTNISVNGFEIKKGESVTWDSKSSSWVTKKGVKLPSYIEVGNPSNFIEINSYFEIGDKFFFKFGEQYPRMFMSITTGVLLVVAGIDVNTKNEIVYYVVCLSDLEAYKQGVLAHTKIYSVDEKRFHKHMVRTEEYWFVNSSCRVAKRYTGLNTDSDIWLEKTNNFFLTKEAATNYMKSILNEN